MAIFDFTGLDSISSALHVGVPALIAGVLGGLLGWWAQDTLCDSVKSKPWLFPLMLAFAGLGFAIVLGLAK
jgi:hypothetical protein